MTAAWELATNVGVGRAAEAFELPRATVYRARQPRPARVPAPRPAPPRALKVEERQAVLEVLHSERFVDVAPKEVFATLLDERSVPVLVADDVSGPRRTPRKYGSGATSCATRPTPSRSCWRPSPTRCGPGTSPSSWGR